MSQAFYRKWRPLGWDEVVGQDHVVRTLRNAVAQGNIAHAYLFSGPRGTGKTTTARIIAKAANCLEEDQAKRPCNTCDNCRAVNESRFLDLIEIDAASNTSVDDVRDLREKISFSPSVGRFKVYIIDEVHMLSSAAFNALLKTLEEPPNHAIFVLATTEVHKIPATVLSRCQRHEFRRIPLNIIQAVLKEIADKEKIQVDPAALTAIARQATGSLRDAVSLLDQLASTGSDVSLDLTREVLGTAAGLNVMELVEEILKEDTGAGIAVINRALDSGTDPRQFGRQVVDALRAILLVKMGNAGQVESTLEEMGKLKDIAGRFQLPRLLSAIYAFDRAAQHTNVGWQPGLQLELALARVIEAEKEEEEKTQQREKKAAGEKSAPAPYPQKSRSNKPAAKAINKQGIEPPPELHTDSVESKRIVNPEKKSEKIEIQPEEKKTGSGSGSLAAVKDSWKEVRARAKEISPETAALLNSCRSVEIVKGRLVLGFSSPLLCSKMENGRNLDNARAAVKDVTGADVLIDCRVAGKSETALPNDADVEKDGMVGAALSLGGKITKKEKTEE